MKKIKEANLPIKRIEEFNEDNIGPWFRNCDLFLQSGMGPYIRVFWERPPTKDDLLKIRRIIK
jgi:hypothetical protein